MKILKFRLNEKIIAAVVVVVFIILVLLPLFSIARFDHPKADDFGYGFLPHVYWDMNHNVGELFEYAYKTARSSYDTWQGTFSSIFLMALTPSVISEELYVIVPYIMLGSLICSVMVLCKVVLHDMLKASHAQWIIISLAVLLILIEEIYTPGSAFFWYNSAIHYTFMQSAMFMMIAVAAKAMIVPSKIKTGVYIGLTVVCACLVAGGNYVNALIGLVLLISLLIAVFVFSKKSRIKSLLLLIPTAVYSALFVLNVTAPGNAIRGANYTGLSAVQSILNSFISGGKRGVSWVSLFTVAVMIALVPSVWNFLKKSGFRFKYPLLVVLFSFCLFSAMFTSSYYSLGNDGLPRALNNAKMMYQLLLFGNEIYLLGWLERVLREKKKEKEIAHLAVFYLLATATICSIFLANDNKEAYYPSYAAFKYVREGFAELYHNTYMERLALLNSDEDVVYLQEFEPKLNLLYIDDVTTDPNDWRNQQVASWYQKTAVYLKPTEE